jgi:hypothetical protein
MWPQPRWPFTTAHGPNPTPQPRPGWGHAVADVAVSVLHAAPATVRLHGAESAHSTPWLADAPARLHVFSGADQAQVLAALDAGRTATDGPARLVLVAADRCRTRHPQRTSPALAARRWPGARGRGVSCCPHHRSNGLCVHGRSGGLPRHGTRIGAGFAEAGGGSRCALL